MLQCVAVCAFFLSDFCLICCSVLQCVAVCCSVLQCVAVCCRECARSLSSLSCRHVLQCIAVCCSELQCVAVCCIVLQYVAESALFLSHLSLKCICVAVCCSVLQYDAVRCNVL